MAKTREQLKKKGIVPGAKIQDAIDGEVGIVASESEWKLSSFSGVVGQDIHGRSLYAYEDLADNGMRWAKVLSEDKGLQLGTYCLCNHEEIEAIRTLAERSGLVENWSKETSSVGVWYSRWNDRSVLHPLSSPFGLTEIPFNQFVIQLLNTEVPKKELTLKVAKEALTELQRCVPSGSTASRVIKELTDQYQLR